MTSRIRASSDDVADQALQSGGGASKAYIVDSVGQIVWPVVSRVPERRGIRHHHRRKAELEIGSVIG